MMADISDWVMYEGRLSDTPQDLTLQFMGF